MATETPEQIIARLQAENDQLKQDNATAEEAIGELNEKLSNVEAAEVKHEVVTYEKVKYRVLAQKFSYKGAEVEAKDLQQNKEVLKALVEAKSGLLQAIQ